jgi:rhodanese-related sulfurtransferase
MDQRHIQNLLWTARSRLQRVMPHEALKAQRDGAFLVDIRPHYQRRADGDIPAAIVIERNHLEWRLDPCSPAHIPEASAHDQRWIIICDQGYSSSLAAVSLQDAGLPNATDVIGGFQLWRAEGCPVSPNHPPAAPRLAPDDARLRAPDSRSRAPDDARGRASGDAR